VRKESRIIILRGNSGSGKTTVAKKLQRQLGRGTLLVSQDVVRRDMLYERDGPGTQAIGLLIELIRYGSKNCENVILEGILYADWYRELFESVKSAFENRVYAWYFDIPFEETLARHKTKPNALEFGETEMRRWWREQDLIGIIPERLIGKDMTEDETVDAVLACLAPEIKAL